MGLFGWHKVCLGKFGYGRQVKLGCGMLRQGMVCHVEARKIKRKEKSMVYKWKYYNYPVDANVVGKALEDIEQDNGEITA